MVNRPCPLCSHHLSRRKYSVDSFRIVRCLNCGFVYLANPPEPETERDNYESYFQSTQSADESESRKDLDSILIINEHRISMLKQYCPGGKLLDVGCGRGYFLHQAKQAGFQVEGVEISHRAAQYASEHFDVTVHIDNLDEETSFDGDYDIITMWHVLEHFQDPVTALQQVWTVLSPRGHLFIEVPNLRSLFFQLASNSKKWRGGNHPRYHRSFFTRDTLHRLLEQTGFINKWDEHMVYDTGRSWITLASKKILSRFYRDSFLDAVAQKNEYK